MDPSLPEKSYFCPEMKTSDKEDIRKQIKRAALDAGTRKAAGASIASALLREPLYKTAKTVFCYVSTEREPDTGAIIADALASGKVLCVPKCIGKGIMKAVRISSRADLHPGAYGIFEPAEGLPEIAPEDIDLAIVPCVAASRDGRRIGHGAGYYDRFLSPIKAKRICLCFKAFLRDDIPMDAHDLLMDKVISED